MWSTLVILRVESCHLYWFMLMILTFCDISEFILNWSVFCCTHTVAQDYISPAWSICVCRNLFYSLGLCGWTSIPLINTVMKNYGKLWNSLIWRSLWAISLQNWTWSAPKEEKTWGTWNNTAIYGWALYRIITLSHHNIFAIK